MPTEELGSINGAPAEVLPGGGEEVAEQLDSQSLDQTDGEGVMNEDENQTPAIMLDDERRLELVEEESKELQNVATVEENGAHKVDNASGWTPADVVPAFSAVAPSRRRTHYMIKVPRFVDHKLKNAIKLADLRMDEINKKRDFYRAAFQLKRASKGDLLEKLKPARERDRACRDVIQSRRTEMEPYQAALNQFRNAFGTNREKAQELCSSEEELNERIAYLQHRIEHESIPLKEEKQLLREIKRLESTRGQVCANMVLQAELIERMGSREEIQERHKLLGTDLDTLRKDQKQAHAEVEAIEKEIEVLNVALEELRQQLDKYNLAQKEAYESRKELWKQENAQNVEFYNYKRDIQAARKAISEKNLGALEDLCHEHVERIFALWCNDTAFRTTYLKNNEASTLRRLETLDGRSLGPDEEPLLLASDLDTPFESKSNEKENHQTPVNSGSRPNPSKVLVEDLAGKCGKVTATDTVSEIKAPRESKKTEGNNFEATIAPSKTSNAVAKSKPVSQTDNSEEDIVRQEAEAAELKEKRRQEEMSKAKEAAERKRRLAEKKELKALARAQKEAERKEKERAKKLKKKNVAAAAAAEDTNSVDTVSHVEDQKPGTAEEVSARNQAKNAYEDTSKGLFSRKDPIGKKKVPRIVKPSVSKKKMQHFPAWFWLTLGMVLLVVFVTVGILWMKLL